MKKFVEIMKGLVRDEEGASAVEYGVLVAGIILAAIVVIYNVGGHVRDTFQTVDDNLTPNANG